MKIKTILIALGAATIAFFGEYDKRSADKKIKDMETRIAKLESKDTKGE